MNTLTGMETLALAGQLAEAYTEGFRVPPWNEGPEHVEQFRRRLCIDAHRPGFRAVVTRGRSIEGFAIAWPTILPLPAERAYPRIVKHLGRDRVGDLLADALQIDELAVRPGARRSGLGRRLLDMITAGSSRAWLVTSTHATDAVAFYRRCGWHETPPADITGRLVLFLSPDHPQA